MASAHHRILCYQLLNSIGNLPQPKNSTSSSIKTKESWHTQVKCPPFFCEPLQFRELFGSFVETTRRQFLVKVQMVGHGSAILNVSIRFLLTISCSCRRMFRHLPVWPMYIYPHDKGVWYKTPFVHGTWPSSMWIRRARPFVLAGKFHSPFTLYLLLFFQPLCQQAIPNFAYVRGDYLGLYNRLHSYVWSHLFFLGDVDSCFEF